MVHNFKMMLVVFILIRRILFWVAPCTHSEFYSMLFSEIKEHFLYSLMVSAVSAYLKCPLVSTCPCPARNEWLFLGNFLKQCWPFVTSLRGKNSKSLQYYYLGRILVKQCNRLSFQRKNRIIIGKMFWVLLTLWKIKIKL